MMPTRGVPVAERQWLKDGNFMVGSILMVSLLMVVVVVVVRGSCTTTTTMTWDTYITNSSSALTGGFHPVTFKTARPNHLQLLHPCASDLTASASIYCQPVYSL